MSESNRARIAVQRSPESCTIIVNPGGGAGERALLFTLVIPLIAVVAVAAHLVSRSAANGWTNPGPIIALFIALLMTVGVMRMIAATLWSILGREELLIGERALTVTRVLGPIRRTQVFSLDEVSNVRWRERRVVAKGGTYFRKVVSFDSLTRTVDVGTGLSFVEATELERELRVAIDAAPR